MTDNRLSYNPVGIPPTAKPEMLDPITITGAPADLSHLRTVTYRVPTVLRGGMTKNIPVEVTFSCHCYSRKQKVDEVIPEGFMIAREGTKEDPRDRMFDPRRYALSKGLPAIIEQLFATNGGLYVNQHHNFVRVEIVEELLDGTTQPREYFVFLAMRLHAPENAPRIIKLFVESAYPEDLLFDRPRLGGAIAISRAIRNCWEKRPGAETGRQR